MGKDRANPAGDFFKSLKKKEKLKNKSARDAQRDATLVSRPDELQAELVRLEAVEKGGKLNPKLRARLDSLRGKQQALDEKRAAEEAGGAVRVDMSRLFGGRKEPSREEGQRVETMQFPAAPSSGPSSLPATYRPAGGYQLLPPPAYPSGFQHHVPTGEDLPPGIIPPPPVDHAQPQPHLPAPWPPASVQGLPSGGGMPPNPQPASVPSIPPPALPAAKEVTGVPPPKLAGSAPEAPKDPPPTEVSKELVSMVPSALRVKRPRHSVAAAPPARQRPVASDREEKALAADSAKLDAFLSELEGS